MIEIALNLEKNMVNITYNEIFGAALALPPRLRVMLAEYLLQSINTLEQQEIDTFWAENAQPVDEANFTPVPKNILPAKIEELHSQVVENPWVKFAGFFKDDPDFAEIVEAIRAERESNDDSEVDPCLYMAS